MFKEFSCIEELFSEAKHDKNIVGSNASTANRYPIRFVLFDNFRDSFEFVSEMASNGAKVESVDEWMDSEYPNSMITHNKLANQIETFITANSSENWVIAPFSELARFYDNKVNFEFNSLISTIKSIQTNKQGFENKQRVYIPVVGLQGKMSKFYDDTQTTIWYLKNTDRQLNYRLILTNGTDYSVKNISEKYAVINTIKEWLKMWKDNEVSPNIISTSKSIFANAEYAQPDNAFTFCVCSNAHDFLTKGLNLELIDIDDEDNKEDYWQQLAKEIDLTDFSFKNFFNKKFEIFDLADYNTFLKTWFEYNDDYMKWLLTGYYVKRFWNKGYICRVLENCHSYTNMEFTSSIALTIFDLENAELNLEERNIAMKYAADSKIVLSDETQAKLLEKLKQVAELKGYVTALRYITPLTNVEKELLIEWVGKEYIVVSDIKDIYPDLYHYLSKSFANVESSQKWILSYFDSYKKAKIANEYNNSIEDLVNTYNSSEITFNKWYQDYKSIRTLLDARNDIDVYYWIDGLGVDWIPYIDYLIKQRASDHIYINEVLINKSILPTKTDTNKAELNKLSNESLQKKGDLDTYAHKNKSYPTYIVEEIEIIKEAVQEIISEHAGKKIAIVSDHGLTYLSQLLNGYNLAGVSSDHSGRLAIRSTGKCVADNKYIILEDGKTICALRHNSLCGKIPNGQGAHGGCTPEEVLTPIIIISSQQNATKWSAVLPDNEISGVNPIVRFVIKGLTSKDTPYVMYNDTRYELSHLDGDNYETQPLNLDGNKQEITLVVGAETQLFHIKLCLEGETEDLFEDF